MIIAYIPPREMTEEEDEYFNHPRLSAIADKKVPKGSFNQKSLNMGDHLDRRG